MGCTRPVVVVVIWTFHPKDTSVALSVVEPFGGHLLSAATRVGWYDVSNSASRQKFDVFFVCPCHENWLTCGSSRAYATCLYCFL